MKPLEKSTPSWRCKEDLLSCCTSQLSREKGQHFPLCKGKCKKREVCAANLWRGGGAHSGVGAEDYLRPTYIASHYPDTHSEQLRRGLQSPSTTVSRDAIMSLLAVKNYRGTETRQVARGIHSIAVSLATWMLQGTKLQLKKPGFFKHGTSGKERTSILY